MTTVKTTGVAASYKIGHLPNTRQGVGVCLEHNYAVISGIIMLALINLYRTQVPGSVQFCVVTPCDISVNILS
jgi:hypothetical protein